MSRQTVYKKGRLKGTCITVLPDHARALAVIGEGNISLGVRRLVEKEHDTLQEIRAIQTPRPYTKRARG